MLLVVGVAGLDSISSGVVLFESVLGMDVSSVEEVGVGSVLSALVMAGVILGVVVDILGGVGLVVLVVVGVDGLDSISSEVVFLEVVSGVEVVGLGSILFALVMAGVILGVVVVI